MVLVCLPILYVLSIGPAGLAYDKGWLPDHMEDDLTVFYSPVLWLYEEVPAFESFMDGYLEFFWY
jgi:hypothetical protein